MGVKPGTPPRGRKSSQERMADPKWDIAFNINNFSNTSIRPPKIRLSSVHNLFAELDKFPSEWPALISAKAGLREYLKWHALYERTDAGTKASCAELLQLRTHELFLPYDRLGFFLIAAYSPDMGYADPAVNKLALEGDREMLVKVISLRTDDIGYLAAKLLAEFDQKGISPKQFIDLIIKMDAPALKMLRSDLRRLFGIERESAGV